MTLQTTELKLILIYNNIVHAQNNVAQKMDNLACPAFY